MNVNAVNAVNSALINRRTALTAGGLAATALLLTTAPAAEATLSNTPVRNREGLVDTARRGIGVRYVWGGTTTAGWDCSGFTRWVYQQHGVTLPVTSGRQRTAGRVISRSQALPGDLLHWPGHIGIYAGGNGIIDASGSLRRTTERRIWGSPTYLRIGTLEEPNQSPFSDVRPGEEHYDAMVWLAQEGITTGWPDGTFRPLQPVNRDAMAAFLHRMAGRPRVSLPSSSPFRDVARHDEHYEAIVWARQVGITTGWPDGTYKPLEGIDRDAMAAFVYRYAGQPRFSAPSRAPFVDVPVGMMYAREIAWLKDRGITNGWSDGTYRPGQKVSRDAMAAFLHRMATVARVRFGG